MSTIVFIERKCAVCGAVNEYTGLTSTNTFGGGPDLDLRPAEMMRSTMNLWIKECPECGYISENISDPTDVTQEWLQSEKYLTCDGISFESDLAKRFYKYYLINLEAQNTQDAFYAVLHAAWACDDKKDRINAKRCRELAISLAAALIEGGHEEKDEIQVIRSDLMRRAGQFDQLIAAYASVRFDEELLNQILKFEIEKAKDKDDSCYRVEDVTGDDEGEVEIEDEEFP